jgi:hypothetical protein
MMSMDFIDGLFKIAFEGMGYDLRDVFKII